MNMDMNTMATAMLMAKAIGGGGGGSGVTVEALNVTENGSYSEAGKAFSPVTVSVPQMTVASISITENGTYSAPANTAYDVVDVNVSGGGDEDAEDEIIMRTISGSYENSRVTEIGEYAFCACVSLKNVSFPAVTIIGQNAFNICKNLEKVYFPSALKIRGSAFYSCTALTTVSFPSATNISANAFTKAYMLISLYLMGSSLVNLAANTAFNSTPIGGYTTSTGGVYGSIFVPSSLYETYISATNWAYFSERFVSV